jgi:hypothetical protein
LPELRVPKVDFSAVSKALLGARPRPKPRPASTKTNPETEAPKLETQETRPEPAAQAVSPVDYKPAEPTPPRPASPNVRPTGSGKPTTSPSNSWSSSGPRPLYPYWYQPPKKGGSN